MSRGRRTAGIQKSRITRKTPEDRAQIAIERDLAILTGPELAIKYAEGEGRDVFIALLGVTPESLTDHNPFWHYLQACWYDKPEYTAMLSARHREYADDILAVILGQYDAYDGYVCGQPRRSFKSSFLMVGMDWAPKRHWLVDRLDITQFYVHNSIDAAIERLETVKNKNRSHPYIARHFPEFVVPSGEWGTKEAWNWPIRSADSSVSDPSVRAMSVGSKKAGKGAHYRWLDDMEEEDSRESEQVRKDVSQAYEQIRQLEAPEFGREIYVDTPYHPDGQTLTLLNARREDGSQRYKVRWVPALDANDQPEFPNIRKLTVAGLAKERANEIARTGNDAFWYLQYMLEAHSTGTQTMQWEWIQKMDAMTFRRRFLPVSHFTCVYIDSAWKGEENQGKGDDTAIGVIKIWHNGSAYIHVLCELVMSNEMTSDEGALTLCRLMKKWNTPHYAIEQQGEKTFYGLMKQVARGQYLYPVEIDLKGWTKKKKGARIGVWAGACRLGNFYYLEGLAHLDKMEKFARNHPNVKHDDLGDMIGNAYSEEIMSRWVPVGIEEAIPKNALLADIYEDRPPLATRYTGLPAYSN